MAREQVKNELYALFRQEGLQESLKAQMRSKLLTKLRGQTPTKTEDLTSRVVASLVLEYLKRTGKEFTVSVFLAEVGGNAMLASAELAQILGIETLPDSDSLLAFVVTEFQRLVTRPHLHDSAAQTEDYKAIGHVEDRLHSVELQYLAKMKGLPTQETLEEKMIHYQRECEARLRLEKEHEIARIREVEVQAVRLEESAKHRQLLMKAREDLEVQWQTRMEQIKDREREGSERLKLREKDLETQLYLHRQQVLRDMELLRAKEQELKRQAQVEAQAAKLEKDTWETRRLEAENKVKEIEKLKLALEHKAEADFEQFRREYETRHLQEKHKLLDELAEVERVQRKLKDEQDRNESSQRELLRLKQDFSEARDTISDLKSSKERQSQELRCAQEQLRQLSESGRRDLDLLGLREQEIETLKTELQLYRDMAEESKAVSKTLDERHREIVAQMSEEVQRLKKSQGGREPEPRPGSFVGADMSLRWQQLERDEEDLKRRALDWIKPVYKKPRDPFSDLFAPKREPLTAGFSSSLNSREPPKLENIRVEEEPEERKTAPVTVARGNVVRRKEEAPAAVEIPLAVPIERPPPIQRAEIPPAAVVVPVEIPPATAVAPVEIPRTEVEKSAEATLSMSGEELDLAEYALRQQRRRQQFEFLGGDSEESQSDVYSDRFE